MSTSSTDPLRLRSRLRSPKDLPRERLGSVERFSRFHAGVPSAFLSVWSEGKVEGVPCGCVFLDFTSFPGQGHVARKMSKMLKPQLSEYATCMNGFE